MRVLIIQYAVNRLSKHNLNESRARCLHCGFKLLVKLIRRCRSRSFNTHGLRHFHEVQIGVAEVKHVEGPGGHGLRADPGQFDLQNLVLTVGK